MATGREPPILRLRVRGPGVRSGRIAVPDLIKICQELQNTICRQAEAMEGRKTIHPGPTAAMIQNECTLELVGIKKGSTRLEFGLVKPQLPLIPDAEFGVEVIKELTGTINSLGNGNRKVVDPGVLQGLYGFNTVVDPKRISSIEITNRRIGRQPALKATINQIVTERVAARMSGPRTSTVHIDGVLDMADFKIKDLKCRIDPPIGTSITCLFDPDLADQVYSLLRQPVRVDGMATLQPYTDRIESVHIEEIQKLPALFMGERNFFSAQTIQQLATAQKVKPMKDISILRGGFPKDEDVDDFLGEIYSARK